MEILTTKQFKEQSEAILTCLLQGHSFLLTDNDIPVAQLLVLPGSRATTPTCAADSRRLSQQTACCLPIFGDANLARLLGVTEAVFLLIKNGSDYPLRVQGRLQQLAEAVIRQKCMWSSRQIVRWWQAPHPELSGSSPVDYLALPWQSGDQRSDVVFALIRREFLLAGMCDSDIREWLE